jgi:hypothetical protein
MWLVHASTVAQAGGWNLTNDSKILSYTSPVSAALSNIIAV